MGQDIIFVCFTDFEKVFDKMKQKKLREILLTKDLNLKDIRIIKNFCQEQRANIKNYNNITEDIVIRYGIRQNCILSPFFRIVSLKLFVMKFVLERFRIWS